MADSAETSRLWAIADVVPADVETLAGHMAASELLRRYGVDRHSAQAWLREAAKAGDVLLTGRAKGGGPPLGLAWLIFTRAFGGAAYLRLLLVAEGTRGGGLGTALLRASQERSRASANHLYLLATSDNGGARRFYERHGYRHVGDLPGLVWPGIDEALYHKPLRPHADRL